MDMNDLERFKEKPGRPRHLHGRTLATRRGHGKVKAGRSVPGSEIEAWARVTPPGWRCIHVAVEIHDREFHYTAIDEETPAVCPVCGQARRDLAPSEN